MKIAIGNDHAGPAYKEAIVKFLNSKKELQFLIMEQTLRQCRLSRLYSSCS